MFGFKKVEHNLGMYRWKFILISCNSTIYNCGVPLRWVKTLNSYLYSINLETKQLTIVLLQWNLGCQSYWLHLRYGLKTDIRKLNQTLDYKPDKNFINITQQIRRGSSFPKKKGSLWNPNQRDLVAHDNKHHYKTIKNIPYKEQEKDGDHLPWSSSTLALYR